MNQSSLDSEELALLNSYESGEWQSDLTLQRKTNLSRSAESTVKKDKRINIRISSRDLDALQRRALVEGLPYQTLVASILHKYISGSLSEVRMHSE